jgi:elongation factor Ts
MNISLDLLKKLRQDSSAGVADCRQALEDVNGDYAKAKKLLIERGMEKAAKKEGKETSQGVVESYVHSGKIGVLVEVRCETDFVARTDEFKNLAHEIALQVASMNPKSVEELLKTDYIRDTSVTIAQLVKQTVAKVGENITIAQFTRMILGDTIISE